MPHLMSQHKSITTLQGKFILLSYEKLYYLDSKECTKERSRLSLSLIESVHDLAPRL